MSLLAQVAQPYHLNRKNVLPSNKVYFFLQDQLGYLWITTDKGVVKYNGYSTQLFNKAEGLPTDDMWTMIDDNKGRIWVGGSSGQLGYIRNNKYCKTTMRSTNGTIFPYYLHRFHDGVVFFSPYLSLNNLPSICISRNDTIFPYTITESLLDKNDDRHNQITVFLNEKEEAIIAYSDVSYLIGNLESIADSPVHLKVQRLHDVTALRYYEYEKAGIRFLCNRHFVIYTPGSSEEFLLNDITTNKSDTIRPGNWGIDGSIQYISYGINRGQENMLFVFTVDKCIVFDLSDTVRYLYQVDLRRILEKQQGRNDLLHYCSSSLWDTIVATKANGIFLKSRFVDTCFHLHSEIDLNGYASIGTVNDSLSWWWNAEQKRLLCFSKMKQLHSYELKNMSITGVTNYAKDTLLFMGAFSHFFTQKNQQFHRIKLGQFGAAVKRMYEYQANCYFILSKTGVYNIRHGYNQDSLNRVYIDIDRFDDAIPYEYQRKMIAWNSQKLLIFNETEKRTFTAQQINNKADAPIETVCTDPRFGNVFVKTGDNLMFFDPVSGRATAIHSNINLKNATIRVWKNYLLVLGDFGVSFFRIEGFGKISEDITYPNLKKSNYKEILSHSIAAGVLTLQTDEGVYTVNIPDSAAFAHHNKFIVPYRIILQDSNQRVVKNGDTLWLANNTRLLYADVINPLGNGNLRIYYRFEGTKEWTKCIGNDIIRPDFVVPDKYYRIELYCEDDGWRSDITTATVWVQPTWWQKRSTRYLLWGGGIFLIIVIVITSVAVTNRLVMKAHAKKQLQMELELKAIYAQINPHFIFNALTSAMLLIKKNRMDEAYTHVAKFSRLLRSYLNSSRNKYISIADEVANLTNYMELQQARFKERFESIISLEDTLDTRKLIPTLLIQPFVENAINHGILPSERTGRVEIIFRTIKNGIQCTISDNGVGREASRALNRDKDPTQGSYGNLLIKDLIMVFDKYEEMKINITYQDRQAPNAGTDVIIDITYIQPNTKTINTRN